MYVARYSAQGDLLDPLGILIAGTREHETMPSVAFGGGVFLVAWWAITRPPNGEGATGLVRAARVSADGALLDPMGLELGTNTSSPAVAFVGDRFLVVFGGNSISALRVVSVRPENGSVGPSQVLVPTSAFSPRVASNGARALVSYEYEASVSDRSTRLMLLDPDGNVLKEHAWPTQTGYTTEIAGGPPGFGIAYYDNWTGGMHVRRLSPDAEWIDAAPIPVPTGGYPVITRDTSGYLMAYGSPDPTAVRLDDTSATPSTPVAVGPTGSSPEFSLTASGSTRRLAWSSVGTSADVLYTALDSNGAALDPPRTAPRSHSASQVAPALGSVAGKPMIAFCSLGKNERSVRHALLDGSGNAIPASIGAIAGACNPQIATGSGATLLVWQETAIRGALVTADGSIGQSFEIAAGSSNAYESWGVDNARVSATPQGFVVSYHLFGGDTQQSLLHAVVLDAAGVAQGTSELVANGTLAVPISVSGNVLMAWTEAGDTWAGRVFVKRMSDAAAAPIELGKMVGSQPLAVASDGGRVLVAWVEEGSRQIRGAFLASDGSLEHGPFPISPSGHDALSPSAVFDGQRFVVAWRDLRTAWADLYAARVDTSGNVLDGDGVAVSKEPGNELDAALLTSAPDNVWCAYGRLDPTIGAVRTHIRRVVFPLP